MSDTASHGSGGRADRSRDMLPWVGLALGVTSLAAIITVTLVTRAQLNRLRDRNTQLDARAAALEAANSGLQAKQAALASRLAAAEKRSSQLEARIPGKEQLRELAAAAAREELARGRPRHGGGRDGDPARADARAAMAKRGEEIANIREKVKKGEMTEKEGHEAITAKLKTMVPGDAAKRFEKAMAEREKNMTPEQKKQAEKTRNAIVDGIGEWMEVQKKVKDGKMTQEEARKLMREKWRARMEEFRKMREAGQKLPEAKEQF